MLGTKSAFFIGTLSVCGALGCSAGQASHSETNQQPGIGPGSGNGSGTGSSGAGAPSINTSSGGEQDAGDCGSTLDVLYRDFSESHPDFEMKFSGDVVRRGLIETTLGADQKPVFKDRIGHPALATSPTAINTDWQPTEPVITSADSFKQWYNTSAVNRAIPKQLALSELTPGTGLFGYDSTAFFPLSPSEGFGITPKGNDQGMNFLFTTEIHVQFKYTAGQKFTFRGDDDLWIFVNGQLALDLGSMHNAEEGTIDFDAQAAALNIAIGGTYSMDVFHAERHTRASNFRVTTNISCFTPGILK